MQIKIQLFKSSNLLIFKKIHTRGFSLLSFSYLCTRIIDDLLHEFIYGDQLKS